MLNKVCLTVDRYTKVEFVPQAEGVEPEIVIGIDKDHVEIFGEESDLIRFAEELYAKVTKLKERKLISERFNAYVERFGGRFKSVFQTYDLCALTYEITEGHRDMDCGLELFDSYAMNFAVDGTRFTVEVGDDFMPVVKIGEETIQFSDYYNVNTEVAYSLGEFFLNFARGQLIDKGWNQK